MGLFGGGGSKTTTTMDPWGPQIPYLTKGFKEAGDLYDSKKGTPFYEGDLYAGMDPLTSRGILGVEDWATGGGGDITKAMRDAGLMGTTALPTYMANARAMFDSAGMNPEALLDTAGKFAANPHMDGMVDAATRDVTRQLHEEVLPGIDRVASANGNINSSRTGAAAAIAERAAGDRIADVSATLRGDAWNTGLQMAEGAREFDTNARMAANEAIARGAAMGLDAATAGHSMGYADQDAMIKAGAIRQADEQGELDADFMRWTGNDTRDADLLNQYWGLIGSNSWGGTTTSKTKKSMSPLQAAIGIGSLVAAPFTGGSSLALAGGMAGGGGGGGMLSSFFGG